MSNISICCNSLVIPPPSSIQSTTLKRAIHRRQRTVSASAAKSGGFSFNSIFKTGGCKTCEGGGGGIQCPGCKGTGKNKKDGNMFERWKCYRCQGFGLVSCPSCGKGGLTPEQRGER